MADEIVQLATKTLEFEEVTKDVEGNVTSWRNIDNYRRRRLAVDARKWMLPKVFGPRSRTLTGSRRSRM